MSDKNGMPKVEEEIVGPQFVKKKLLLHLSQWREFIEEFKDSQVPMHEFFWFRIWEIIAKEKLPPGNPNSQKYRFFRFGHFCGFVECLRLLGEWHGKLEPEKCQKYIKQIVDPWIPKKEDKVKEGEPFACPKCESTKTTSDITDEGELEGLACDECHHKWKPWEDEKNE